MQYSGTNPSLQLWQWYNADPNTHMRTRSDGTTLSIIALTSRRFSKTKPKYNIQQSKYKYMYITDNYGIFQPHSSNSMIYTKYLIVWYRTNLLHLAIVSLELTRAAHRCFKDMTICRDDRTNVRWPNAYVKYQ